VFIVRKHISGPGSLIALLLTLNPSFGQTATTAPSDSNARASVNTRTSSQLEQLAAPVALYPDSLLAQIFMAATYPIEVVQTSRWLKAHGDLKGEKLKEALADERWDPSVKSLVMFPSILGRMNENLDWTQDLGDAFLAQQQDLMKAVQRLRTKANEAGNLKSTNEQKVVVEKEIIRIEPADPEIVYVPVYNPTVVYGPSWVYPVWTYPTMMVAPGYIVGSNAVAFSAGVTVGAMMFGGCNWHSHNVYIINNHYYGNRVYVNTVNVHETNVLVGGRHTYVYNNVTVQTWQHNRYHNTTVVNNNVYISRRNEPPLAGVYREPARSVVAESRYHGGGFREHFVESPHYPPARPGYRPNGYGGGGAGMHRR